MQESKKTIQITFELKATNQELSNNTTNFTLSVDLKKTKGKIDVKTVIGETLVQNADNITTSSGALFQLYYKDIQSTESYLPCKASPPTGQNTFSYSKANFTKELINQIKKKNEEKAADKKIPYSKIEFTTDNDAGDGTHSFNFKFYFNDTDYDLDEEQKSGIEYRIDVIGGQIENQDGTKSDVLTWIP